MFFRCLFPFHIFKDCSVSARSELKKNIGFNIYHRFLLLPYLFFWMETALSFFAFLLFSDRVGFSSLIQAAFAISFIISTIFSLCIAICFLFLCSMNEKI